MSIYKGSYSQSKCVFLAGPIEWWWKSNRFESAEARMYRTYRSILNNVLVGRGYLVYRPFEAFKGEWNEKMQVVNDFVLLKCDALIEITPPGVEALGTDHEVELAKANDIPVLAGAFVGYGGFPSWGWDSDAQEFAHRVVDALDNALARVLH